MISYKNNFANMNTPCGCISDNSEDTVYYQGPQGNPGPQGPQGPRGERGAQGPEDKKVIRAVLDLQDQEVCTARPVHKVRRVFAVMQVQRETTVQWGRKAYGEIPAHKEYKVNVDQLVQRGILVMWGRQVQKVSLATWGRQVRRACRALRENKVCRVQLARRVCREK